MLSLKVLLLLLLECTIKQLYFVVARPKIYKNVTSGHHAATIHPDVCITDHCLLVSRYLRLSIDLSVDPCEDFYQYACGLWTRLHPSERFQGSVNMVGILEDRNIEDLKFILETMEPDMYKEKSIKMLQNVFNKCVDENEVEKLGTKPLIQHINEYFGTTPNISDLTLISRAAQLPFSQMEFLVAQLWINCGLNTIFTAYIGADEMNTTFNILNIDRATLTLGFNSADYYLNQSKTYANVRKHYMKLMEEISAALWTKNSNKYPTETQKIDAALLLDFEIQLAALEKISNRRNNRRAMYNRMTVRSMHEFGNNFKMFNYVSHFGVQDSVNVVDPTYIKKLDELLGRTSENVIKGYLLWRLIFSQLPFLARPLSDKYYAFKKVLHGAGRSANRRKYCVQYLMGNIGDDMEAFGYALGRLYVDMKNFTNHTKRSVDEIIGGLLRSFSTLLEKSKWMDEATKAKAHLKIQKMSIFVGYSDIIQHDLDSIYAALLKNISGFSETRITEMDNFYEINKKLNAWSAQKQKLKVNAQFDRTVFAGSPAFVNAWYDQHKNAVVFPAGILQPPLYHPQFPMYLNFGITGSTIGHEIAHGFDDQGSHFDAYGNLENWWSAESKEQFETKTQCLIDQYSSFCYPELGENVCIKGAETLSESIADIGGLLQSYSAYTRFLDSGNDLVIPSFEEFTFEQLFFISYATSECANYVDEALLEKISTNQHPPGRERVTGTLQNIPEFSDAFKCPIGSRMNPSRKCDIW